MVQTCSTLLTVLPKRHERINIQGQTKTGATSQKVGDSSRLFLPVSLFQFNNLQIFESSILDGETHQCTYFLYAISTGSTGIYKKHL